MPYVQRTRKREIREQYLYPHHSDPVFAKPQTVYLEADLSVRVEVNGEFIDGAYYVDSDKLAGQYKREDREAAWKKAQAEGHKKNSAEFLESYLRHLTKDQELQLVHLVVGLNPGNGYPYWVYGLIPGKQEA